MSLSHCNRCGHEIGKVPSWITGNLVGIEPNFCRYCGNVLVSEELGDQAPWDGPEDDEEFSLYNFDDLEEIVKGIVPENYKDLSYYILVPCDCDKVTYIPDEANPYFMRKA